MTFLFWNIRRAELTGRVAELAEEHAVDVLMLAESDLDAVQTVQALNGGGESVWAFALTPIPLENGLQVYVRGAESFVIAKFDLPRASIREVKFPAMAPITLVLAHLQSPMYRSEDDRASAAGQLALVIKQIEQEAGHTRTVVVGDLNMDPFSKGLLSADAFNAVMTRDIADTEDRTINGTRYQFFFNPTWKLLGDGVAAPGGTYFYRPAGFLSLHWRMFDQVLIRPRLMKSFDNADLEILNQTRSGPLHNGGKPDASDHFPLKFKLNL